MLHDVLYCLYFLSENYTMSMMYYLLVEFMIIVMNKYCLQGKNVYDSGNTHSTLSFTSFEKSIIQEKSRNYFSKYSLVKKKKYQETFYCTIFSFLTTMRIYVLHRQVFIGIYFVSFWPYLWVGSLYFFLKVATSDAVETL